MPKKQEITNVTYPHAPSLSSPLLLPLPLDEQRCRFSLYNLRKLFLHTVKTQPEVGSPVIPFPTSRPHFLLFLPSILIHLLSSISYHPCPLIPHHSPSPLIPGPFLSPLSLSRYFSSHPSSIATLNINPPSPSLILSSHISSIIPLPAPS